MFVSQRFGDEKVTVKPIGQTEAARDPKRQPNVDVAQGAANSRSENKTETERHADHAEGASAFFLWCYICDVGHRCWNARGGNSRDDASEKEPADRGRERHHDV